jgi:hypothetical protein
MGTASSSITGSATVTAFESIVAQRLRTSEALTRGLDKLISHGEFVTFGNEVFMLFAMAFQLALQQWLVHMAKFILPHIRQRRPELIPPTLIEDHKLAMTAAQKFQALLVPATLDATGPELCVQNQRAMLDLKGVLEHLIRQEASMLSSALSLQLFADADATEIRSQMDAFASQRGDQLLVLPFVAHQLSVEQLRGFREYIGGAEKEKLKDGTEKYLQVWRFSHSPPLTAAATETGGGFFSSPQCCSGRKSSQQRASGSRFDDAQFLE